MADVKPLKLRREKATLPRAVASVSAYATVLVEHDVFHLDEVFEYLIPEIFSDVIQTGTLVEVPLGSVARAGIVIQRGDVPETHGQLKAITNVISGIPYVNARGLELCTSAATNYGVRVWDFIRSCIPQYSKMGERKYLSSSKQVAQSIPHAPGKVLPSELETHLESATAPSCAITVPRGLSYLEVIKEIITLRQIQGSVLLLVPTLRESVRLHTELSDLGFDPILITSDLNKSDRYANYLAAIHSSNSVIVGTRSSALLPFENSATVLVIDDNDESHYERRSPTWNSREVVEFRKPMDSVIYLSASMSLEIADRVDNVGLPHFNIPGPRISDFRSRNSDGDQSYFPIIREALARGPVLISLPNSGYITSFSCQKCRNIATCHCGSKLYFPARSNKPMCATCNTQFINWSCTWCGGSTPRAIQSGVERKAEEFGRSFPNYPVVMSNAAYPVDQIENVGSLVIATPGMEPIGSYMAQIFLGLEGRLLRTTLRSTEEVRLHLLKTMTMLNPKGKVYLDVLSSDALFQSMILGNPHLAANKELIFRDEAELPPHWFALLVYGTDVKQVVNVLQTQPNIKILGPFVRRGVETILVKGPFSHRDKTVSTLHQINKVQSARKKPLFAYQVDPYSLN